MRIIEFYLKFVDDIVLTLVIVEICINIYGWIYAYLLSFTCEFKGIL